MQLHIVPYADIKILPSRQRKEKDQGKILELAASIAESGLIHPINLRTLDGELVLISGERRILALEHLWFLGTEVTCGDRIIPEGHVPSICHGVIDQIDAEEIELEENIRREDLTWRERADSVARLASLRARQAAAKGLPLPTTADLARSIKPESTAGKADSELGAHQADVRKDIILGNALKDPLAAAAIAPATSRKEAIKLLKRHEDTKRSAALGAALAPTFNSSVHTLLRGDCLSLMSELPDASFDVILTDPPYGTDADSFGDSGGKAAGAHFYDDTYGSWLVLAKALAESSYRLAKAEAHAYVFCDIDRFAELRSFFLDAGWKPFRTPLIFVNPSGARAPWPEMGPQRKWQAILYAVKGNRPVTRLYGDVLTYGPDNNLGHPAQKPVGLLMDLLRRSVRPGDSVLDPCCGTGSIFPAAHELTCKATGIELDDAACGIAATRLGGLK